MWKSPLWWRVICLGFWWQGGKQRLRFQCQRKTSKMRQNYFNCNIISTFLFWLTTGGPIKGGKYWWIKMGSDQGVILCWPNNGRRIGTRLQSNSWNVSVRVRAHHGLLLKCRFWFERSGQDLAFALLQPRASGAAEGHTGSSWAGN